MLPIESIVFGILNDLHLWYVHKLRGIFLSDFSVPPSPGRQAKLPKELIVHTKNDICHTLMTIYLTPKAMT